MYRFGRTSLERLGQCELPLQQLFNEVIKYFDCKVTCGYRTPEEQKQLYKEKRTKTLKSKHNLYPSRAIDVIPHPFKAEDWNNLDRFSFFGGGVLMLADRLDIKIRWGGDWNKNFTSSDETFIDAPHFELI